MARAIEVEGVLRFEDLGGKRSGGRGRKGKVPAFHSRGNGEALARVLMGENGRASRVKPGIAIGVIEVPVGIDKAIDQARG